MDSTNRALYDIDIEVSSEPELVSLLYYSLTYTTRIDLDTRLQAEGLLIIRVKEQGSGRMVGITCGFELYESVRSRILDTGFEKDHRFRPQEVYTRNTP